MVFGYPRNREDANAWSKIISNRVNVRFLMSLDLEESEMRKRTFGAYAAQDLSISNFSRELVHDAVLRSRNLQALTAKFDQAGLLKTVSAAGSISRVFTRV